MSLSAAVIRELVGAGLAGEELVSACERIEAAQTPRRNANAERQARFRARQKEKQGVTNVTGNVTGNAPPKKEIPPTPPKEKTTPLSESANALSGDRDFFAEFWLAYPSREGPNPKKPARDRFLRLVAKGANPETIIAAAATLAKEHPTPTRFVPQAVTWLNQERFADEEPVVTGTEFCPDEWAATKPLVVRFREKHGSDPPRAIHGGKPGFMIPAEWVAISKQRQVANA